MIYEAPVSFVSALCITSAITFFVVKWYYDEIIGTLRARHELKDDQLADYKTKLEGRTPDEVKARIDTLETRLRELEPRRLDAAQRSAISNAVSGLNGRIAVTQDMAVQEARHLAGDIASAFRDASWNVSMGQVMGPSNPPATGLALKVRDVNNLTPVQAAILSALRVVGQVEIQALTGGPAGTVDAEIFVTTKLR